jgi:hypothetical protein
MIKRKVRRIREDGEQSSTKIISMKILTKRFGAAYEKGRNKFTGGIVKGIIGKVYEVLWTETQKQ